jgi:uncharacterized integral membrane protein
VRWVNLAVITVFVIAMAIFAVQNFQTVTVSFLNTRVSVPLALMIVVIYLLGMLTGGSVWALIRRAIEGSKTTA